jgi:hypothetical protein
MDLHFRVGADGAVLDVSERGETPFADADVTSCVLAVCRNARLPATADTSFDYSVQFESAADPPRSWTAMRSSLTANVHSVR